MSFSWAEDFENRREIISSVMKFSRSSSSVALKFFDPNPGNVLFFQYLITMTGLGGKTCDRNFVSLYVIVRSNILLDLRKQCQLQRRPNALFEAPTT